MSLTSHPRSSSSFLRVLLSSEVWCVQLLRWTGPPLDRKISLWFPPPKMSFFLLGVTKFEVRRKREKLGFHPSGPKPFEFSNPLGPQTLPGRHPHTISQLWSGQRSWLRCHHACALGVMTDGHHLQQRVTDSRCPHPFANVSSGRIGKRTLRLCEACDDWSLSDPRVPSPSLEKPPAAGRLSTHVLWIVGGCFPLRGAEDRGSLSRCSPVSRRERSCTCSTPPWACWLAMSKSARSGNCSTCMVDFSRPLEAAVQQRPRVEKREILGGPSTPSYFPDLGRIFGPDLARPLAVVGLAQVGQTRLAEVE